MQDIFRKEGVKNSRNSTYQFWRQDNHPIQLTSAGVLEQKLNYLHNNPVEAGYVDAPEDYIYSSAPAIAGKPALLKLEPF